MTVTRASIALAPALTLMRNAALRPVLGAGRAIMTS
jgi:hypothetical protein